MSTRMAALAAVLAGVSLVGHLFDLDVLKRGLRDLPAMSPHTALSVAALAAVLLQQRLRVALAGLAVASGLLAVGVDALEVNAAAGWVASPGTGALIVLLALAMLFPGMRMVAAIAGVAAVGVLIALLMDLPAVYEPGGLVADSGVSVPTATSLSLLSAAWLLRWVDLDDPAMRRLVGWSARSLLGVVVVLLSGRLLDVDRGPVAAAAVFVAAIGPLVAAWRAAGTEREAIRAAGDVRRLMLEDPNSAVLFVDRAGRIVEASAKAGELLGGAPDELAGMRVEEFVPDELRDLHVQHRAAYARGASRLDMSSRDVLDFVTRQGERRTARIGLARMVDDEGLPFFAVTLVDVTALTEQAEQAQRQAEELQRALNLQVEAAERALQLEQTKSLLLEAISHELRTPMAAVLGMSELLATPLSELDVDVDVDLRQRLRRQARILHRRLSALMDLSPAGQLRPPKPQEVTVEELVIPVVDEVRDEEGRSIQLQGRVDLLTRVDLGQLRRLLDGLLLNACRHAPDGDIRVVVEMAGREVLVAVEDEGPGVPVDRREAIFEPFVSGADGADPGVGIGLALVRRIAELNGVRCWVEDAPGGGARFVVTLPLADTARAKSGHEVEAAPSPDGAA